jgi:hypothetical protein
LTGGVWVGTIEGCPISGRSENGFTVFASGIDENGNPVSNYVLGKGLIEILETDGTITPDAPSYYVHLYDEVPTTPKEGDLYPVPDGYALWADGKANLLKGMTETEAGQMDSLQIQLDDEHAAIIQLNGLIPPQASIQNQLADKAFVNSSVQTATANFRGNWAVWSDVPTDESFYPSDYAGSTIPTVNDYLVVQDARGYNGGLGGYDGTWRFKYSGTWATDGKDGWYPEYQVNETPMTAAQLAAINSNITAAKVAQYDAALIDTNYVFHTASPDSQHPTLPKSAFPIIFTRDGTSTYNSMSELRLTEDMGGLYWQLEDSDYTIIALFDYVTGAFVAPGFEGTITFNGQSSANLIYPYMLQNRAVNSLSVSANDATKDVMFPDQITGHARDFMVRIVASAGTYGTAPALNMSGVTLMNANGEMPEIKTDTTTACTTLIYFSEIAANVFLCKGENLEAITL